MATRVLTPEQHELLEMLSSELRMQLDTTLGRGLNSSNNQQYLQELAEALDSFSNAAELIGLQGLASAWRMLLENVNALSVVDCITEAQFLLIDSWVMFFLDFLQQLENGEITAESVLPLIDFLASPDWPMPFVEIQKAQLQNDLLHAQVASAESDTHQLPTVATPELLSLVLSDDINADLFEGLMIEMPTQVAEFGDQINHYIQQHTRNSLASAQRIAHTLKGSANIVGISGLANFMHFSEDLLEEIAKHDEPLTPSLKILLIDMSDTLAAMLDGLTLRDVHGHSVGNAELAVMQQVLNAYHAIRTEGFAGYCIDDKGATHLSDANASELLPEDIDALRTIENNVVGAVAVEASSHIAPAQDASTTHVRIKEETAQDLLRLAGESAIATNRLQTQVHDVKTQVQHINQLHNKLTQLTEEFGYLIEVRELFMNRSKNSADDSMDPLELDRYNELHSFFHQLQEFATDTRDAIYQTQGQLRDLEELTFEQQVTNRASQHHLLEMRMIPANNLEARFQRCVRQACRLTGKQVRFSLRGGNTMIDSRVLHELIDPLMHLLRNAVDHGIESVDERIAQGKPIEGKVELQFVVQGQSIIVRVVDDGAGLHRERIAQKARELAIKPPSDGNAEITDLWLKQIIFVAGFSTRDQVSQTSGRGIGLDMVADRINQLKGRITVDSKPAMGCEFSIRLPMPMITEQGLLIKSGHHNLAISSRGIEQLLFLDETSLKNTGDQLRYTFNQQDIDVFHIAQLARLPDTLSINALDAHALLVVESLPGQHIGVLLERVSASREIVIKPLTPLTPPVPGVIGATILGDGDVAPVIDVQHLVLEMLQRGENAIDWMSDAMRMGQQTMTHKPMALIVDDSLSTRRSLAQFVGDMGMDVRTAKDGFEAIDILQEQTPHIMLVDMEMPRMNGLELTAHVRANDITRHVPVIMITSRNTEKHRNLAAAAGVNIYLNKPFSEEELLHHIQENMQL